MVRCNGRSKVRVLDRGGQDNGTTYTFTVSVVQEIKKAVARYTVPYL